MEVIQLSDDDDDFIQSVNPSAPRRSSSKQAEASFSKDAKVFKRPPPISTRIDSDPILKPSTSATSIDDDECPICGRDLRLLNEQRRTLHLNSCLDDGEAKADLDKSMDKWKSTMDCPVCKTPLAAGPFRSAHIKKCGREHAINGKDLLNLVNTQEKVADSRRKRALPHTSAKTPKLRPKKVSKLDGEPKSMAEEELLMAKALSASMMDPSEMEKEEELKKKKNKEEEKKGKIGEGVSPQFTRIINENIRRRRSYAVVELAPRGCRCDIIELIQSRFLRVFRARRKVIGRVEKRREGKKKKEEEETDRVKERLNEGEKRTLRTVHIEATMANTLSRLDALSWAYRNIASEGERRGDVSIECTDGQMRAFSWSLLARTTALGRVVEENMKLSIVQPTTVVRHWLQYVYCGRVEWAVGGENDGVREIAKQHGPEGLVEECARMAKTRREYLGFGRIGGVTEEEDTVATVPKDTTVLPTVPSKDTVPSKATVPPVETPEEIAADSELLPPPTQEDPLPSDDARMEEREEEEGHKEGQTMDSEGSISDALKKCAADGRVAASPRPLDGSFLAALQHPPPIETTPTTVPPPPARETPKDSFFDSIAYGETPKRKEEEQAPPPTVIPPPSTVVQPADPAESAESMDEEDAVRNILDVSCLRRSPRIRVAGDEEEEGRKETVISPELFDDSEEYDEGGGEGRSREMSQRVPSPRSSPRRFSSQSIPADTVTPTTSRPSLRKLILGQKKLQEVIYLDDTPVSSPITVATKPVTVSIEKKEEITVDESFPRVDQPSYGQGGMDTVDTVDGGEERENRDEPMDDGEEERREGGGVEEDENVYERSFEYNDDYGAHDWNEYEGGEEEADPSVAARAREEVDSFLQSLNESRHKMASSPSKAARSSAEVDSFLLSMRMGMESSKEDEEEEREEGTGDILGALSPVRKETEPVFKTPIVRGGRGRGRGARGGRGAAFGSNVKVLKWSNVTPKPQFEAMDDAALKTQLARYGLRPMGRKRAIAMLSEIYEQTHPVVDEGAAASSSRSSTDGGEISPTKKKSTIEEEDEEDDGEKTLNRSESSDEEGSERGGGVGAAEESMIIPKASLKSADNQLVLFLEWLRQPPQKDLYDHCLALKSISLEELEVKLKRADSALCGISRKVLMCVLDRLHITYSLPQDGWKRKRK